MDIGTERKKEQSTDNGRKGRTLSHKSVQELRSEEVKVRFSLIELSTVEKLAKSEGLPIGVYCRESALKNERVTTQDTERWMTLGRLGSEYVVQRNELLKLQQEILNNRVLPAEFLSKLEENKRLLESAIEEIKLLREGLL